MLDVRPTAGIPLQQIIWDIFMDFLSLIILVVIASLLWRISDQLPDVLFRLGEIQRDIADIRKIQADDSNTHESTAD
ncbi:MAG: hypothetical protein GWP50_04050 [Proteobacteria bacterium]|nr:hypothetical protein [Pseudomonadota bacterium]